MKDRQQDREASDADLVAKARGGDSRAMDVLVARHHASAYRMALGILRDEEAAADATQDAFLKAFKGLRGFRGDASFKTWLLTIAANQAKGMLRTRGRRNEVALDGAGPVASDEDGADVALEKGEEVARIDALLESLPEKQKQTVRLRIFESMSFRDIGVLIGSSEGAARVNYHHAVRRLREMMK